MRVGAGRVMRYVNQLRAGDLCDRTSQSGHIVNGGRVLAVTIELVLAVQVHEDGRGGGGRRGR